MRTATHSLPADTPASTASPRAARPRAWLAPALLAATLAGTQAAQEPRDPAKAAAVADTRRELDAALSRRFPVEARTLGVQPDGSPFGRVGPEGAKEWSNQLVVAQHRLEKVPPAALGPDERAERAALLERVRAESLLVQTLARDRRDPVFYVERVESALASALGEPAGCDLTEVLAELPELWRTAQRGLIAPRLPWIGEALDRLLRMEVLLEGLGGAGDATADPTCAAALDATRDFATWLEEAAGRIGEPPSHMGAQNWAVLVETVSGSRLTPAELQTRLLRDIARLDTEMGAGRALGPAAEPDPRAIEERLAQGSALGLARAEEALRRTGLEAGFRAHARLDDSPVTPFEVLVTRGDEHVLELAVPGGSWPEEMRATRLARLGPVAALAWGARYGAPGEALLRTLAGRAEGARSMLWNRAMREGWGLYALDWMQRVQPAGAEPLSDALRAELARLRLVEAARLLASLERHARGLTLDAVARNLRARTRFDPRTADLEARLSAHDPLRGVGYLGCLELQALETELARSLAPEDALHRTLTLVAEHPCARPADLRPRPGG